MAQINWSEKDQKYWIKDLNGENLFFDAPLDAALAARRIEIERAVTGELARITAWLKAHGMRQIADAIERGEYK